MMNTLPKTPTPKIPLSSSVGPKKARKIIYPDSDGKRMADNTKQADEIIWLKTNFDDLFANAPDVFVAADLLWYPVEGDNKTRMAPDALIAFGARKGYRGSYKQWEEGFPPQVVFEVLSLGNRRAEMVRKRTFYETYGVEEYYVYDPYKSFLTGWLRDPATNRLTPVIPVDGFTSPRLGIRFDAPGGRDWVIYRPDGSRFKTPLEIRAEREQAERERERAEKETGRIAAERDQANAERDLLAAKLRELGIDPATL